MTVGKRISKSRQHKQVKKAVKLPPFDKYKLYTESVQSPETDAEFLQKVYRELNTNEPKLMREDFCGTFALCCEWVKLDPSYQAIGVDIDQEPINYGKEHIFSQLEDSKKSQIEILERNVLNGPALPPADVVCALNFSYFCFKQRQVLKTYFERVYESLNKDGVFVLDCFGGSKCHEANEEETEFTDLKYSYFWDQDHFDPVSNFGQFYIHFQRKNEAKRRQVFSYDWRLWSIPELRDLLEEAGFSTTHIYWEGNDENGDGNGIYSKVDVGEECESWVAYIIAHKK